MRLTHSDVFYEIEAEADRAETIYGPFTSTHEAFGVLAEEVAELLDAIRSNKSESVRQEAVQVSAVAFRLARLIRAADAQFTTRSGFRE